MGEVRNIYRDNGNSKKRSWGLWRYYKCDLERKTDVCIADRAEIELIMRVRRSDEDSKSEKKKNVI